VGLRRKAYACGRLIPGIAASNPAEDMDVCDLRMWCVWEVASEAGLSLVQRSPAVCVCVCVCV
jgi:hypothetical protein